MAKSEKEIMHEVQLALGSMPNIRLWRINPGQGWISTTRGMVPQQFAPAGFPDLVGWIVLGGNARWLGVEIKTDRGTLSESQKQFMDICLKHGAYYWVVRSVEEALAMVGSVQ